MSDINDVIYAFKNGGQVQTDDIADSAVTADKLASGAVTAGKLGAGSVTATELASNAVTTVKIAASQVTLAKLAAGITPSHIIVLAGTTAAYGGGGTSNGFTVTGLLATDSVSVVINASTNAVSIVKAVPTANTLTVDFSADPGAATTVNYIVARAAA